MMVFDEQFGQNKQRFWNVVLNLADTMRPTMRINLQNIKENGQKSFMDEFLVVISKLDQIWVENNLFFQGLETFTEISFLGKS